MIIKAQFNELNQDMRADFGVIHNVSDGGYESGLDEGQKQGYALGYNDGHEAGYTAGHKEGYDEGKAEGDSWYDAFWDNYQLNGTRTEYRIAFASWKSSGVWDDIAFKPKYDIKLVGDSREMFYGSSITDLVAILNKQGVVFDTSKCTNFSNMFAYSKITHVGIIDTRGVSQGNAISGIFLEANDLHTIDKFILPSTKSLQLVYLAQAFKCNSLENITVEGTIYADIDFKRAPLTVESAKGIINCLESYADTENKFVYTVSFSTTTWGYLDEEGETASPNGNSWREYINDLGWNAS